MKPKQVEKGGGRRSESSVGTSSHGSSERRPASQSMNDCVCLKSCGGQRHAHFQPSPKPTIEFEPEETLKMPLPPAAGGCSFRWT